MWSIQTTASKTIMDCAREIINEIINSFTITKMCACPCHDSMYSLIRNTLAVVNQNQRNNPYQFTHDNDNT